MTSNRIESGGVPHRTATHTRGNHSDDWQDTEPCDCDQAPAPKPPTCKCYKTNNFHNYAAVMTDCASEWTVTEDCPIHGNTSTAVTPTQMENVRREIERRVNFFLMDGGPHKPSIGHKAADIAIEVVTAWHTASLAKAREDVLDELQSTKADWEEALVLLETAREELLKLADKWDAVAEETTRGPVMVGALKACASELRALRLTAPGEKK